MAVRVAGPGGVVPHHRRLELLDRDLHLPAARPDPGGGVLGQPADDLDRGPVLGGVVGGGDLRVQRGGQRPGLRTVDHDLDEPQALLVGTQPALRRPGLDVVPGDPPLVGRPVQRPPSPDHSVLARTPGRTPSGVGVATYRVGQAGALGEVVVIDPGAVGLDVGARGAGRAAVELDPTVHASSPPVSRRQLALK